MHSEYIDAFLSLLLVDHIQNFLKCLATMGCVTKRGRGCILLKKSSGSPFFKKE